MLLCADIETGQAVWQYTDSDSPYFSSPAISDNRLVTGSRDHNIYCHDKKNGKLIWKFKTLDEVSSSPVICGDKVIAGSDDGRLYMINIENGKKTWSFEIGESITSSPAVASSMVLIGSDDGWVYAFGQK